MNKLLIDLEAIYQKAFENVRYIDVPKEIKKWRKACDAKEVAVFGNLTRKHMNHIAEQLVALKKQFAKDNFVLNIYDGYSEMEKQSFTDLVLASYLYKDFFSQSSPTENNYTLAVADSRYFNIMNDLQNKAGGNQFGLITVDDLPYEIPEVFKLVTQVNVNSANITMVEKIIIQESLRNIQFGAKKKQYYTIKNIAQQNLQNSKIPFTQTIFVIAAMIGKRVLTRIPMQMKAEDGSTVNYLALDMGSDKAVEEFLKKYNLELK